MTSISKFSIAALLITVLTPSAFSADFSVNLPSERIESADGAYFAQSVTKDGPLYTNYQLVPASTIVEALLQSAKCEGPVTLEASVLSRDIEIDHENRGPSQETVKLLVRKIKSCRLVRN